MSVFDPWLQALFFSIREIRVIRGFVRQAFQPDPGQVRLESLTY
jgi:hypothetical protein